MIMCCFYPGYWSRRPARSTRTTARSGLWHQNGLQHLAALGRGGGGFDLG